jgi:hypothetical protein
MRGARTAWAAAAWGLMAAAGAAQDLPAGALAEWDARLRAAAAEAVREKRPVSFPFSIVGRAVQLEAVSDKGPLRLLDGTTPMELDWSLLPLRDKKALALALVRPGDRPADLALAAFYLLAAGDRRPAAPLVRKLPETEASALKALFGEIREDAPPAKPAGPAAAGAPPPSKAPPGSRLPEGVDAAWKPFVFSEARVRECRMGIEIGYTVFDKKFGKDPEKAAAAANAFIERLNTYWVSEVMIHWTLAALVLRKTAAEDPHPDGTENGRLWGETRRLFVEEKKLDFGLKISSAMNGGLGGGRCATLPTPWWAFDHEASHGFGLPHEHGWPYDRGPQNISNPWSLYGKLPRGFPSDPGDAPGLWYGEKGLEHTFSKKNVDDMMRDVRGLKDLGPYSRPRPPYAAMDVVRLAVSPASSAPSVRTAIDVLANDHDCNNGPIWIKSFDPRTLRGAGVKRAAGGAPGGRDALTYEIAGTARFTFHDVFTYTAVDPDGLENKGHVLVLVDTPNLLLNGDFEAGNAPWVGTGAFVEPAQKDRPKGGSRLRLAAGGSARQRVALKPGASYRLTVHCEIPKGQKLVLGVAGKDPKAPPAISKELSTGWLMRAFYFTAAANADEGMIVLSRPEGGAGDVFVDDADLRPVGPAEAGEYAKDWPNDAKE